MPNDTATQSLPLSRILVLDMTIARAGPTCVRHLADWGADVIRIEPPFNGSEDVIGRRNGSDFQNLHRNKRVISLNLKSAEGHAIFMKLAQRADVIVENMRAPVKHRLKVAWEDVKKVNPRVVYGSISGFGQDGPDSSRPGVDQIAQGMGGMMSVTGIPGQGPLRVGIPMNDLVAGSLLAFGIMMALFDREHTQVGKWVYTSLLESQVFMLDFQAARYLMDGKVAGQTGNEHPTLIPQGVFPTSDGQINLSATASHQWIHLCDALGKPEWKTKSEWKTVALRCADRGAVHAAIAELTRQKPSLYWIEQFDKGGIPCGPINTIDKVFAEPQVQHLGLAAPVTSPLFGETHVVASPLNIAGVPKNIRSPTPEAGAHTDSVLRWLDYSEKEIGGLRSSGVI
jgi:formyl-CoA transferase